MSTQIGQNSPVKNFVSRQQICEITAPVGGGDVTVTNADLLALLAGATFDNGLPADDAATVYMHSIEFTLAHLNDEGADDFASTTCQATVTDIDTTKLTDLEPGGSYPITLSEGHDVQDLELVVADGSLVRACVCVSVEMDKAGEAVPKPE